MRVIEGVQSGVTADGKVQIRIEDDRRVQVGISTNEGVKEGVIVVGQVTDREVGAALKNIAIPITPWRAENAKV